MKVKQVLEKYHKKVPFPISPEKITKAGYVVGEYLLSLLKELDACEDREKAEDVRKMISELERR